MLRSGSAIVLLPTSAIALRSTGIDVHGEGKARPSALPRAYRLTFVVNHVAFFVSHRLPIALEAIRRGWTVGLVTGKAGSDEMERAALEVLADSGILHRRVGFSSSGVNPLSELRGFVELVVELRRQQPDLIHCASPKGLLYGGLAARLLKEPALVLAVSGLGFAFTPGLRAGALRRRCVAFIFRILASLAYKHRRKRVIVQNEDDSNWVLQSQLATREEVRVIPGSGVDLARFSMKASERKQRIVLLPARMLQDKGVVEFVEAVRLIRSDAPGWRFLLAGAADYESPSSIPRGSLDAWNREGVVEWVGHVEDIAPLLRISGIVCLPSYREGMPKVLLEAAAASCAVVTTDAIGCREAIVAGKTGDLVPIGDSVALARTLLALINDAARRQSYGEAGCRLAHERYDLRKIMRDIFAVYSEFNLAA